MSSEELIPRVTGLLVIEVRNANPNGDPDQESDPRVRGHDDRGLISPVSFKRKLRDLVEDKTLTSAWNDLKGDLNNEEFQILESRGRRREEIKALNAESFKARYWDARVFGNTFLEGLTDEEKRQRTAAMRDTGIDPYAHLIRAGVVHFGPGLSVSPVRIQRETWTNKAGVESDKDRGMAPHASRYVEHGVYCMPFFVNPTGACKTGCKQRDIDLLRRLIPHGYRSNPSVARNGGVEIRQAWWVEHKSRLGSCSDFAIIDALTPQRGCDEDKPSQKWGDYSPGALGIELTSKVQSVTDLMNERT